MISITTRLLLIIAALIAFFYIVSQIRNSNLTIRDSIFWVILSFVLVLLAVFPDIVSFFSELLGIESPSNFLYITIIAVMIVRIYRLSIHISTLNTKIKELTQSLAIQEYETSSRFNNKDK